MSYQALLFCPEEKIARVVTQVLSELEFSIETATEPFGAVKKLMAQHFDAIVVDCENEQNATLVFKSARNSSSNQSSLAVAVVEGQAGVAKAFRIGANLVLTKPINVEQAKGTLRVARGLLRKGSESAKSSSATTAGPSGQSAHTQAATGDAPRMPAQDSTLQRPRFQAPKTVTPKIDIGTEIPSAVASTTSFDVDKNSASQPNVSAQFDSMNRSAAPSNSSAGQSSPPELSDQKPATSKNFPWQRASKDSIGPVETPLQRAGEGSSESATDAEQQPRPFIATASQGHAAATAPAREKPSGVTTSGPEIDRAAKKGSLLFESDAPVIGKRSPAAFGASTPAPSVSTRRLENTGKESGGSNKTLVAVAAILLISVGGYFGWRVTHGKAGKLTLPGMQAPISNPVPQPGATIQGTPQTKDQTADVSAETQPGRKAGATAARAGTPGSKPTAAISASGNKADAGTASADDVTVTKVEPMVVRNDVKQPPPAVSQAQPDAPLPNALNIAGGSGTDKAISNIMTSTPVTVPKPVPQSVKVSQGVSQGLLIKKVQPNYPAQALTMRLQGQVELQATINKDGSVSNLKVLNGESILSRAALDAVRQWKYKPYYLNGEPVEIQTQIVVNFKLPN